MASGAGMRAMSRMQQFAKSFAEASQTLGKRSGSAALGNLGESMASGSCKGATKRGAPVRSDTSGRIPRASVFESEGAMHHSFAS